MKKNNADHRNLHFVCDFLLKPNKKKLTLLFFVTVLTPIISNTIPLMSQFILNTIVLQQGKYNDRIFLCVLVSIFLYILKCLLSISGQNLIIKIRTQSLAKLKKWFIERVVNFPVSFHDQNSAQYTLSMLNEVDSFSSLFSPSLLVSIVSIFSAILALFAIFSYSNFLGAIVVISFPVFALIMTKLYQSAYAQIADIKETSAKNNVDMLATMSGILTLKEFNEEQNEIRNIAKRIDAIELKNKAYGSAINVKTNITITIVSIIQVLLSCACALIINMGQLSPGSYLSLCQYITLAYAPVLSLQTAIVTVKPALVSFKRISKFIDIKDTRASQQSIDTVKSISTENLTFHYSNHQNVISNLSLTLNIGDKILICGPNGCGKTTLCKLLLGFYDNYLGCIKYNNLELKNINTTSIRDHVSYLSQKPFLFNCSIKENIRLADRKLSDKAFQDKINYFVSIGLLNGIDLDQIVTDNGKNLSGGQVQRIALARVLLRDREVVIFDEFENSLDSTTNNVVKAIIASEFRNKICLIVSHSAHWTSICNVVVDLNQHA